ncbi:uncharacterized protein BJX67DRAFT_352656 [Aspergillus lucknowensis]|uniref:Uncharacterized protein n=1 Tax=Aspergillus lucknowensis TaxID=176173 RepID=A0ABR4LW31_9EURO
MSSSTHDMEARTSSSQFLLSKDLPLEHLLPRHLILSTAESSDDEDPEGLSEHDREILRRAIKEIYYFSKGTKETDLVLKLNGRVIESNQLEAVLEETKVRYNRPASNILVLKAMPTGVHESVQEFAIRALEKLRSHILNPDEARCLYPAWRTVLLPGMIPDDPDAEVDRDNDLEGRGDERTPDAMYGFRLHAYPQFPVVFEASFSQPYDKVLNVMRYWLTKTDGETRLVIIVDIREDRQALNQQRRKDVVKQRIAQLLRESGSPLAMTRNDDILEYLSSIDEKTMGSCKRKPLRSLQSRVHPEDWVGPLQVRFEFWESTTSGPRKRGRSVLLMPRQTRARLLPPIRAGDLIPPEYQDRFPGFDASRSFRLDPSEYQSLLEEEIPMLAFRRACRFLCPEKYENC